jgi:transposase
MRKISEVLRLRFEMGFGYRQIAQSCLIGVGTVHEYLKRAEAAGVQWPLPDGMTETKLDELLFGRRDSAGADRTTPDFAAVHEQLRTHKHLTLQLVWEEYREAQPDGYGYSRFCELYNRYRRTLDVVRRQEHVPGEKMFVDWAGDTAAIHNRSNDQIQPASLFVAVLGFSSYTYAEATHDEQMEAWLGAHMRALEYYRGAPRLVVPDNTKTGVTKACRYDPDLNPTYQDFALHYGMGVVPARPYKPRDKARSNPEFSSPSAGSWRPYDAARLSAWPRQTPRSGNFSRNSTSGRSANAKARAPVCFKPRSMPPCARCLPDALTSVSGRAPGSTSIITWSWIPTSTAFRITWCTRWSRFAPRRRRWRSFIKATALRLTSAAVIMARPSRSRNTGPKATKRIWSGRPRAW